MIQHLTLLAAQLQAAPTYTCPKSRPDFWNKLSPAANIVVGDVIGLKPLIILVIIGLVAALVIAAAFKNARAVILNALGWVVGMSVLGGILITVAVSVIGGVGC